MLGTWDAGSLPRLRQSSIALALQLDSHVRCTSGSFVQEAGLMSRLRHSNIVLYMGVCSEPPCLLVRPCLPACLLVWPCLARLCRCPLAALGCMPRGNCSAHQHSADAVLPMASYAMCCRWSTAAARALMTCWLGAARIPLRCVGAQLHGEGMAVSMQMHLRGRCTRCSMAGRAMPAAHCRCLHIRSRTP